MEKQNTKKIETTKIIKEVPQANITSETSKKLQKLKGKIKFSIDLKELREN